MEQCHIGVKNQPKKCHILFEIPLTLLFKYSYQITEPGGVAVRRHVPEREKGQKDSAVSDQVRHEQEDVVGLEAVGQVRRGSRRLGSALVICHDLWVVLTD